MTTIKEAFEGCRARLIEVAKQADEGQCVYTGSAIALGLTYRADDLTVVWTGDSTFVVIPKEGEIQTQDLCPDRSLMSDMIESMCNDGVGMCELVANVHRMRVAQERMGRAA